jgi:hypothetical protein
MQSGFPVCHVFLAEESGGQDARATLRRNRFLDFSKERGYQATT